MSGARIKCFDTCIVVFQRRETWEDAEAVCKARGGHLFVPETSEQESSVSTYLEAVYSNGRDTNFWIGGQILETNQEQWLSDRVVNYPYLWGITKPTATDEPLCIAMDPTKSFRWTAYSCNNPSFFLCEEKTPYESRIFG
ncbi:snaclec B7-like [Mercenaria mercenaria]|uniref:snaclec B7-like n=1 Tax=Mercenaria mercenaria TaxID=6596 RepID=UPI00234F4734|nr:snaclec B7-like [Mercenaria mercenaria]